MLGAALHLGSGVKRNPVEALVWLTRARAGGRTAPGWPPVPGGYERDMKEASK